MTRVSTADGWSSALMNLMNAQSRLFDAQNQVSTTKIATDLKGYGRSAESLTAFKSAQARLSGFVANGEAVASRLQSQDLALNTIADAADGARQGIAEALASGRGDALMIDLEGRFQQALDGLNAKHEGRFLFGGGRTDSSPVTADTLADLTAAATVDDLFTNDALKQASRLDDYTVVETGFLADELGRDLFDTFRQLKAFNDGPDGPFSGELTPAQRTFLEGLIGDFQSAHTATVNAAARNGSLQTRVESHVDSQKDQADALEGIIGKRTDVDMAEALTRLQQQQLAVQASAQVISQLKDVSLLTLLR